jgi:oxygen-independent coproporphyrinogen-3 oxidase
MQRNFMGYTTRAGFDLLAFGVSAISRVGRDFAQNVKTTDEYIQTVESGRLPVCHGMRLSDDDVLRESVIQSLMCYGEVDVAKVEAEHGVDLLATRGTRAGLEELEGDGLIEWSDRRLIVTPVGRYFIRNIAMVFDPYLSKAPEATSPEGRPVQIRFSRTV